MEVAGALKEQICPITDRFEGEPPEKKQKIEEAVVPPSPTSDSDDSDYAVEYDGGYEEREVPLDKICVEATMDRVKFAIEENNKNEDNAKYELIRLVKMNFALNGPNMFYYFTLKVKEKDDPNGKPVICRAKVADSFSGDPSLLEFYKDSQADEIFGLQEVEKFPGCTCGALLRSAHVGKV